MGDDGSFFSPAYPINYPNADDIAQARAAGFGYGMPWSGFTQGASSPLTLSKSPLGQSTYTMLQNLAKRPLPKGAPQQNVVDMENAAALAANRSPISALGFDPRHMAIDTSGLPYNLGGTYSPDMDQGWVAGHDPDALVHESTHRGLFKIGDTVNGPWTPAASYLMGPGQEMAVRRLMDQQFNGVERGKGSLGDNQINNSATLFRIDGDMQPTLNMLQDLAARLIQQRQPGGPR